MITSVSMEDRMRELIDIINNASYKYYISEDDETALTDREYNKYLYELEHLEAITGIKMPNSPSVASIGYDDPDAKIKHFEPVLSLKSTKNIDELLYFLDVEDGILSWKLDGVSIILHYDNGHLDLALSRGDGYLGRDITKNVIFMSNVLQDIPYQKKLIIRGEGCISLKEFELLKQTEEGEHYSNPRNLVSGLVSRTKSSSLLLKSAIFLPHSIIFIEESNHKVRTRNTDFDFLKALGFEVVPYSFVKNFNLKEEIEKFTSKVDKFTYPVDGLVLTINNIERGQDRGSTLKFPKHSMAYKWEDISVLTRVTGMLWSVSKKGYITPIVMFEPVTIEGTVVKQANLHSLAKFNQLALGIGDLIEVYKANKIIPEVGENLTRSGTLEYPKICPACNYPTHIVSNTKSQKLYCLHCKEESG